MGTEKAFCHATGLKEGKAQKDGIAHAPPDGSRQVITGYRMQRFPVSAPYRYRCRS